MTAGEVTEHFCSAGITPATSADNDEDSPTLMLTLVDDPIVIVASLPDDDSTPQQKYRGCITKTSGLSQGADDMDDLW